MQGLKNLTPMPSATEIIKQMLKYLLDPNDTDRAFVTFNPTDNVVMLVNNFGGLSGLELEALTDLALQTLKSDWNIVPQRIYAGIMETSLNGQGFSITLGNMSGMAKAMSISDDDVFALLDAPTNAPAWPKNNYVPVEVSKEMEARRQQAHAAHNEGGSAGHGPATPTNLVAALTSACNAGLAAEPTITQYDLQMGDGDCGEAVAGVCNAILANLSSSPPPLLTLLERIGENVEDVGGSLGAILSILLTAFINALAAATTAKDGPADLTLATCSAAATHALANLKNYTSARTGDRTVMDVLIPFIETLAASQDLGQAVRVAQEGAAQTANMKAKFGRATYISDDGGERSKIPDPGAYAAGVWLKGLLDGFN
jgi:dihydroxyacetone kinase